MNQENVCELYQPMASTGTQAEANSNEYHTERLIFCVKYKHIKF